MIGIMAIVMDKLTLFIRLFDGNAADSYLHGPFEFQFPTGKPISPVFTVISPIRFESEYEETAIDHPGHGYAHPAPGPDHPGMAQ